jgi:solute carrier family 35 protein F1/2
VVHLYLNMSGEDIKKDYTRSSPEPATEDLHDVDRSNQHELGTSSTVRPPLDYSSLGAFVPSFWRRFKSIWTKRFALSLFAGQVVSLCITCTNVTTTELVSRGWGLPTTQSVFLYFSLFMVYTPYTIYQYGFKGWSQVILRDGWKYIFLAACDVEGNFMVVKAYQYTDLLSCMLLDSCVYDLHLFYTSSVLMTIGYQMGNTSMHVPLLGIHAPKIHLVSDYGSFSLHRRLGHARRL